VDLRARWEQLNGVPDAVHPTHADACHHLGEPVWPNFFERCDPGATLFPVEYPQPFFDLRLVNYVLAIPISWSLDKTILRSAVRGTLPEIVRLRRKTLLARDPVLALLGRGDAQWVNRIDPPSELIPFVDHRKIPEVAGLSHADADPYECHLNMRPWTLSS
jgi:hypothetical protein